MQTVRNIFRKLGPELIEVELAPEYITPASLTDLEQEIALHRKMQENVIQKFLKDAKKPNLMEFS